MPVYIKIITHFDIHRNIWAADEPAVLPQSCHEIWVDALIRVLMGIVKHADSEKRIVQILHTIDLKQGVVSYTFSVKSAMGH